MGSFNINIMLIIAVIAAVCKMVDGYKKGMVKEIISLVSMVVLCLVAALIANGVHSYFDGNFFNVVVAVVLLAVLGIVHHFVDKIAGIAFGVVEVILILWTIYAFIMMMDIGAIGQAILSYTEDNPILLWIYQHNYLARWIEQLLEEFSFTPLEELQELWNVVAGSK